MSGFSTIELGGTIVSPLRLNYDLSISSSTTVALAYSNASITDRVGLQVVIYNSSSSSITLTAGTQYTNYTSYPNYCTVLDEIVIPAYQSITLITTVIGQEYTIESISGKVSIDKGAAGNIVYQTAANRTGFLAAGTQDYVLSSGGPNQPPKWSLLSTGNLAGGVAGSLDYQSAPNATAKSAAGSAFGNGGGGIAGMTSSTTVGWNNVGLRNGFNGSYSGGNFTISNPRAWAFSTSDIAGSGSNLYTYLTANGVPQYDGNVYTIFNNSSSNFVLTIKNIANPDAWSNALITSFAGGANQITLYPYETITFSQFNSDNLTIVDATQSLGLSAIYTIAPTTGPSAGVFSPAVGTVVYDPNNWNAVGTTQYTARQTGMYQFTIYINQSNAFNTFPYVQAMKNTTVAANFFVRSIAHNPNDVANNGTYALTFTVQLDKNDYITFNAAKLPSGLWVGGLLVITLLN